MSRRCTLHNNDDDNDMKKSTIAHTCTCIHSYTSKRTPLNSDNFCLPRPKRWWLLQLHGAEGVYQAFQNAHGPAFFPTFQVWLWLTTHLLKHVRTEPQTLVLVFKWEFKQVGIPTKARAGFYLKGWFLWGRPLQGQGFGKHFQTRFASLNKIRQ